MRHDTATYWNPTQVPLLQIQANLHLHLFPISNWFGEHNLLILFNPLHIAALCARAASRDQRWVHYFWTSALYNMPAAAWIMTVLQKWMTLFIFISSDDDDDTPHVNTPSITSGPRYGSKHKGLCHSVPNGTFFLDPQSIRASTLWSLENKWGG